MIFIQVKYTFIYLCAYIIIDSVRSVAFSPDNSYIVTGSDDRTVNLINLSYIYE